ITIICLDKFTENDIVGNAFGLFIAAYETVSTAISFCLYELSLNKSIQDRIRKEMELVKTRFVDNEEKYDMFNQLHYTDMVLAALKYFVETVRKYPPVAALFREATQDYNMTEGLLLEKGIKIIIPIYSIHYNKMYYPNPYKFDPDRFLPEEKIKIRNGTYLPFGDGPRICIGKRFAELEMKIALLEFLTNFEVAPCEKTDIPIKFSKNSFVVVPKNGIWLHIKKLNKTSKFS
ncbi:probable cytochrome P450 6a13, partial [Daktulosphaira vitifoliae]|uniref:probable cytochrome P450 6a13 n=1 Tax=Daktulosphaira vitifoliae TaxID=58002 RepID=UPI0021AAC7EE